MSTERTFCEPCQGHHNGPACLAVDAGEVTFTADVTYLDRFRYLPR